jgi:hypothetical protein
VTLDYLVEGIERRSETDENGGVGLEELFERLDQAALDADERRMPLVMAMPGHARRGEGGAKPLAQQPLVLQGTQVAPDGLVGDIELCCEAGNRYRALGADGFEDHRLPRSHVPGAGVRRPVRGETGMSAGHRSCTPK